MMDNQVPQPPNSVRLISGPLKSFSYLYNALKGLMTLLVGSTLSQVSPDPHVLPQENLAVLLQPIKHLDRENKLICRISHETLQVPAWHPLGRAWGRGAGATWSSWCATCSPAAGGEPRSRGSQTTRGWRPPEINVSKCLWCPWNVLRYLWEVFDIFLRSLRSVIETFF